LKALPILPLALNNGFQQRLLQKAREEDKLGSLRKSVGGHSDEFSAFKPKHALFFVIPAKAGTRSGGSG
jgi:hypothetical protein